MSEKLILDTDIGTDIDDAVCLAYLLAQPECELLGITTVTGGARDRAKIASALCTRAGQPGIPIHVGVERSLLIDGWQTKAQQAAALDKWPGRDDFPATGGLAAVRFLIETIRAHPGEITLLTIGPLTNIALAFALDPELPGLLKRLVTMGGAFFAPLDATAEWNIALDPHAAAMTAAATARVGLRPRWVGLDVTTQVVMDAEAVRARFAPHPLLATVLDFAEVWFRERPAITFHDPLAAVAIFDEGVCAFERGDLAVELIAQKPGRTLWTPNAESGAHWAAREVDAGRFFAGYFGVFGV
jgi:inosine-uridine nucleoside N-ribohydrolase